MSKPYVLILEDDPKLVDIYQMIFQQAGFDTVLDTNGNQYTTMLLPVAPALIILDLHLPYASGVEVLQRIKNDNHLAKVPVIVTTADIILAKTVQGKADVVLTKPVSVIRLREAALRICSLNN